MKAVICPFGPNEPILERLRAGLPLINECKLPAKV